MTRLGLQKLLDRFPEDAPIAFADPHSTMPGCDLDPDSIIHLEEEHIEPGVEDFRESYITPEGRICKASDFVLIRVPVSTNPLAFP